LVTLGGFFERMVIHDLRDSTFFATLYIRHDERILEVDSRPSDAMALACRTETPIFIEEEVLERARVLLPEEADDSEESSSETAEGGEPEPDLVPVAIDPEASVDELEEILKNLDPEDFGKYKM
jgi:bifunctional DNase/RNase